MKVRFQYASRNDHDVPDTWEGPVEDADQAPPTVVPFDGWVYEPNDEGYNGIIRMYAICDHGTETVFVFDDIYFLYILDGAWVFGSGTPKREFILRLGQKGSEGLERPVLLPKNAIFRRGVTLTPEDAALYGLTAKKADPLHPLRIVPVERDGCCD